MKTLKDFLNELQLTDKGEKGKGPRKSVHYPRSFKSKLPPGVRDLWKVDGDMKPKPEADEYVTKKLKTSGMSDEDIDKMNLEKKLDKAKELRLIK